jgi:membrane protease YdiL (CAAX protease family)
VQQGDGLEEPRAARRMTFLGAAAWSLGLGLVSGVLRDLTESARPGAAFDLVNLTVCEVVAFSLFLFVMLRLYAPLASIRDVLALRPVSPLATGLALAVGALLAPGLSIVDDAITRRFPLSAEESELWGKLVDVSSRSERLVLFASCALVIPLCEELFFRGLLFRGLRRGRAEGLAVVASALLYALARGVDPRFLPTGLVLGLLASWLRGRSGSIVPAAAANIALRAAPLLPLALGKGEVDVGARVAIGGTIAAALCAWVAGTIFARNRRAEEGRLLDA